MHNQKKDNNNLKTKNDQNCQKIELYGGPTTKEIKKKHSSRLVGGAEMGSWVDRTCGKAAVGGLGWARQWLVDPARWQIVEWGRHSCSWPARQQLVDRVTDRATQSSSMGK